MMCTSTVFLSHRACFHARPSWARTITLLRFEASLLGQSSCTELTIARRTHKELYVVPMAKELQVGTVAEVR